MKQLHLKTEDKGPEDSIIVNLKGSLLHNANTAEKQGMMKNLEGHCLRRKEGPLITQDGGLPLRSAL